MDEIYARRYSVKEMVDLIWSTKNEEGRPVLEMREIMELMFKQEWYYEENGTPWEERRASEIDYDDPQDIVVQQLRVQQLSPSPYYAEFYERAQKENWNRWTALAHLGRVAGRINYSYKSMRGASVLSPDQRDQRSWIHLLGNHRIGMTSTESLKREEEWQRVDNLQEYNKRLAAERRKERHQELRESSQTVRFLEGSAQKVDQVADMIAREVRLWRYDPATPVRSAECVQSIAKRLRNRVEQMVDRSMAEEC